MSIDKKILFRKLRRFLIDNYHEVNLPLVLRLCEIIICNNSTRKCIRKSPSSKWNGLDRRKSLFKTKKNRGLPIGNLTSQVFVNFYMSFLDHYVKHELGTKYYGRYVDDFFLIHEDKEYLTKCKNSISGF